MTQEQIQIIITMTKQGVEVSGHINDKLLAYGLLEQAKDSLRAYHEQQAKKGGLTIVREPLPQNGHA